tara:strand:+ start:695 stop:1003 length:309 start_codon:yes stop_codon:yes gene_type:complete
MVFGHVGFMGAGPGLPDRLSTIVDRTREFLSASDMGLVWAHRIFWGAAGLYSERGVAPPSASDPNIFMVRSVSLHSPTETVWTEAAASFMNAELGADFDYKP